MQPAKTSQSHLGERWCGYPERVEQAIDKFLLTEIACPELRTYSRNARTGNIQ